MLRQCLKKLKECLNVAKNWHKIKRWAKDCLKAVVKDVAGTGLGSAVELRRGRERSAKAGWDKAEEILRSTTTRPSPSSERSG